MSAKRSDYGDPLDPPSAVRYQVPGTNSYLGTCGAGCWESTGMVPGTSYSSTAAAVELRGAAGC